MHQGHKFSALVVKLRERSSNPLNFIGCLCDVLGVIRVERVTSSSSVGNGVIQVPLSVDAAHMFSKLVLRNPETPHPQSHSIEWQLLPALPHSLKN